MVAEGDDPLLSGSLSKRDRETLLRLIKKYPKTQLDDLIAQERSRLACTPKSDLGAPKSPKAQQALLVALYLARCCHAPITVRRAAQEIYDVVEIRIIRPRKHGGPTAARNIKSVGALQEDLRVGLKANDAQTVAAMIAMLVFWRRHHVDPKWPATCAVSPKQTISIFPKKPARLIRWIDAMAAKLPTLLSSDSTAAKLITE